MIGFLVRDRVRIKIRFRVRVEVTFKVSIYQRSKCRTFTILPAFRAEDMHVICYSTECKGTQEEEIPRK